MFGKGKILNVIKVICLTAICIIQSTSCFADTEHLADNGGDARGVLKRRSVFDWFTGGKQSTVEQPHNVDVVGLKISDLLYAGSSGQCHMIFTDTEDRNTQEIVVPEKIPKISEVVGFETIVRNSYVNYSVGSNFSKLGEIEKLELWTSKTTLVTDFIYNPELIRVFKNSTNETIYFPISRWLIGGKHRTFYKYDTFLPQFDPLPEDREADLSKLREEYAYDIHNKEVLTPRIMKTPRGEEYSGKYMLEMGIKNAMTAGAALLEGSINEEKNFTSIQDMINIFGELKIDKPKYANMDFKEDDVWFARSRLQGANVGVIRLVKKRLPKKLIVKNTDLGKLLRNDKTIKKAIKNQKLFIIDYHMLTPLEKFRVPTPIALFHLDEKEVLRPVAIQLYQESIENKSNPVFTPNDKKNVWLMAKLWFHVADSSYQQSIAHLGLSHYLVEGILAVTHRTLSISHPVFKLLKPHFLFNIAANTLADKMVTASGGLADTALAITGKGLLIGANIGLERYEMSRDGIIPNFFEDQGVTEDIIQDYPFRDDISRAWTITRDYVSKMLNLHYENNEDVVGDEELKAWRLELSKRVNKKKPKGMGIKGIPGDDKEGFKDLEEVIDLATVIIISASVRHAAANYVQFDWYAFAPNQPSIMNNDPPTDKEAEITDDDILKALPNRKQFMAIVMASKLLSTKKTRSLGDFEVPRFYHPDAVKVVEEYQQKLKELTDTIIEENKTRKPYTYCIPENVPNSIPI